MAEEALEHLKLRYARGEITKKEYNSIMQGLKGEASPKTFPKKSTDNFKHVEAKIENDVLQTVKSKPYLIGLAVVAIIAIVYLIYANFTPNSISSTFQTSIKSAIGNGNSNLYLPIMLSSQLNTPMSGVTIQAATTAGSVNGCTTRSDGQCNIIFTPPKQSVSSEATVTLTIGTITKTLSVNIAPDPTTTLSLNAANSTLAADGSSSMVVTAHAYDNQSTPVPDGTVISFSLSSSGSGTTSSPTCTTVNGECQITYTSSTTSGQVNLRASSYLANASERITLLVLPPASITLVSSSSSVNADGKSTTIVTAKVTNKLGNPITNANVAFGVSMGSLDQYCITDSSGSCSLTYTSPNQAGSAQISAQVANLTSGISIKLNPVAKVSAQVSLAPYLGNPIVPVYALNHNYLGQDMATITIYNTGSGTFSGTVSLSIPGWSSSASQQVTIQPSGQVVVALNPDLNSQAFSNLQAQPVTYQLEVTNSSGIPVYQNSYSANITSFNTMDWQFPNYGSNLNQINNLIASWVTPGASSIHQLVSSAAQYAPGHSIQGYQLYGTGCGFFGSSPCDQFNSTYLQLKAIYNQLQSEGMHYVNAPQDFSGSQTVYTPAQSLAASGSNCIDGALVFASAVASTGMQPYITLVPGHSFVCVAQWSNSNYVLCVETTMIGSGAAFSQAYSEGNSEFSQYESKGQLGLVNINQVLSAGVKSIPAS